MILLNNRALSVTVRTTHYAGTGRKQSEYDNSPGGQQQLYAWSEVMVLIWLKRDLF